MISVVTSRSPAVETISYLALASTIESADEHSDGPWGGVIASGVRAPYSEHVQTMTKNGALLGPSNEMRSKSPEKLFEVHFKL